MAGHPNDTSASSSAVRRFAVAQAAFSDVVVAPSAQHPDRTAPIVGESSSARESMRARIELLVHPF